jgi:hypothetical protein
MSELERTDAIPDQPESQPYKKPYQKPAFRFERVFETRALVCGKVSTTQGQCAHNKKTS